MHTAPYIYSINTVFLQSDSIIEIEAINNLRMKTDFMSGEERIRLALTVGVVEVRQHCFMTLLVIRGFCDMNMSVIKQLYTSVFKVKPHSRRSSPLRYA